MKKSWGMFYISLGFLSIMLSPYGQPQIIWIILGILLIILGFIMTRGKK